MNDKAIPSPDLMKRMKQETRLVKAMVAAQLANKIEKPKEPEKPKFRKAVHPRKAAEPGSVRKLSTSDSFVSSCQWHKIPATRRQAAKYLQKRGRLWEAEHGKK